LPISNARVRFNESSSLLKRSEMERFFKRGRA
jgi:hypothetical protein